MSVNADVDVTTIAEAAVFSREEKESVPANLVSRLHRNVTETATAIGIGIETETETETVTVKRNW